MADRLKTYRDKRDFRQTSEPEGKLARSRSGHRYLIQKHDATRLHFDFRLELNGVLLSWAVTRGPSYDPQEKRLAVHVEDHPLEYGDFEGTIPAANYGGGTVMLWDEGAWEPIGDPEEGLAKGDLKFILHGERLKGKWVLIRMRGSRKGKYAKADRGRDNWLLIKERDEYAEVEKKPIIERALTSVRSGRTMEEIASGNVEWVSGRRIREAEAAPAPKRKPRERASPEGKRLPAPEWVEPQLATLVEEPPNGKEWLHEIKFDGYRVEAAVGEGKATIYTRTGLDWTNRFRQLAQPLADLPCRAALLDGEAVVQGEDGKTDFGKLQAALAEGKGTIVYYVFDLLSLDGESLLKTPLTERKKKLQKLLADQPKAGPLFYSDHVVGNGRHTFEQACEMNLEGIVSKRADAPYRSGRAKGWLKAKCGLGQEFVIVGWQPSDVKGRPFSSLLVATRDEDRLTYRGKIGTGYGERELQAVWKELSRRQVTKPPLDDVPRAIARKSKFVKPDLVAEIEFRGWTEEGYVRQGAFKGLRADKKASEVVREMPKDPPKPSSVITVTNDQRDSRTITVNGVRVTHPDKMVYKTEEVTKRGLIDYYRAMAKLMLPHVIDRPLSIVRCPDGADGDCFFQKHASPGFPEAFGRVTIKEKEAKGDYLTISGEDGLIAAVQMGALELHIWGSHNKTLEKPDRIVFDFDPDEEVTFNQVKDAAREMRDRLKHLELTSFPMATGGKGLHVVVPLTPKHGWDDVKAFAEAMARTMADDDPDRYLAVMSKARRKGKIFIDYLRNGRGATAIAPYSTRARKGAPVAWPLAWTDLAKLPSAHEASVNNAAALLMKRKTDPWQDYFAVKQILPLDRLSG
jgi:bifunctional non-homologous end joining protein LigD